MRRTVLAASAASVGIHKGNCPQTGTETDTETDRKPTGRYRSDARYTNSEYSRSPVSRLRKRPWPGIPSRLRTSTRK
jgi:hypothetical protein